ncbi:hypothetical protein IAQ61_006104 [Plenodomus lingam]|uniref:Alcohol acetyltransferase n=1 Tax=Leptosphaeria maculans (strain JN3 / isolate v23.1.3 / race Av1-4-5-6-7-8) TaxID=985895 RepID=E4ZMF8_LEPMJ|nr:hypothetical protein LEMA_P052130.1 [Plenodomus lingam JN3]KAH9870627.1 hypothetical protein IAQ61_006104 [Plenodomus lingam]CBX92507.1 hypothetical protein LEMA_P052130.1 [Plenodomus lingam JN3]
MDTLHQLPKLRPLGRSEQLSAVSHELGFFQNVGMSAQYSLTKSSDALDVRRVVYAALAHVIHKHSILSAIPVDEVSPDVYWARLPSIDLERCVTFLTRSKPTAEGEEDSELDKLLQEQHNTSFKENYGSLPFWRLLIVQDAGNELSFTASFIYYHGSGDGAAGLIFHKALRAALDTVSSSPASLADVSAKVDIPNDTQLLPPLEKLHPLPLNPSPSNHKKEGLEEWTGNPIQLPATTHYRTLNISPASSATFSRTCKENNLRLTSGLHAIIAEALFDNLPSTVDALTGILPINLRPWLNLPKDVADDALGTFIDAIKIQMRRADYVATDETPIAGLAAARHASEEIQSYLKDHMSPSGEPYTSVAFYGGIPDVAAAFKSMVGGNREAAFEVSNLGRFMDNAADGQWRIGRMVFSRSAVVFGAAVTTSVVSGGDGALTVGFSWQEGVVDDSFVDAVIGRVKFYLNASPP